jgi:hypothetical protein
MATTHEPLHLDKRSFVQRNIMDLNNMAIVGLSNYWGGCKT